MSLNRWKVLACTLTVGVGGLAVFATDPTPTRADPAKEPGPLPNLTVKPTSPPNGTDTPAPVTPVKAEEFDLTVPIVPPALPADGAKKAAEPMFEPVAPPEIPLVVPVKGEADAKKGEPKKPDADKPVVIPPPPAPDLKAPPKPTAPVIIPTPMVEAPKPPAIEPDIPSISKPPMDAVPPPPLKIEPTAPPKAVPPTTKFADAPEKKPMPPAAVTPPEPVKVPLNAPKATESARLKMLLRMGDGQPRFEIRNTGTTELLLKVYGEKIEMQAPPDSQSTLAGVSAIGRVRFTAPGIEGTCDHLTILSGTGEVLLKGNIHLKTKHGKSSSEMTAEKMVYQIGSTGLNSPAAPRTPITPAGYLPD